MTDTVAAHPVTYALGYALVHFVWQGAVVGLITALLLGFARRAAPTTRYAIACLGLVALAATPVVTFVRALLAAVETSGAGVGGSQVLADFADAAPVVAPTSFELFALISAAAWSPAIVMVWSGGVLLLAARLLVGCRGIGQLRRGAMVDTGSQVAEMGARLAYRLGLTTPVAIVRSALIQVPAVVGVLRPVVVIPASALTGLSVAQFESILAHELAHVRRRDHIVNACQHVVETLLFYHPSVWWVSKQICIEREHCCDDIALSVGGSRTEYARALTALDESRGPQAALSLSAADGLLVRRVRRILGSPTEPIGWPAFTLMIALGITGLTVAMGAAHVQRAEPPAVVPAAQVYPTPPEAQIVALEETYRRARLEHDSATLGRLLDAAFVGGFSAASASNRTQWLSRLGASRVTSLVASTREINMEDGAAVVRGTEMLTVGGTSVQHRYVRAWKLGASGWTLVSHIQTLVPSAKHAGAVPPAVPPPPPPPGVRSVSESVTITGSRQPVLRIGQNGVTAPVKIKDVKPIYPPLAKAAGEQGIVFLESVIDPEGNVTNLQVVRSSGSADLDQAAIDAVSQWKYTPTLLNGVPVSVVCTMTVNFTLKN